MATLMAESKKSLCFIIKDISLYLEFSRRYNRGKSFLKAIKMGLGHFVPVISYAPHN